MTADLHDDVLPVESSDDPIQACLKQVGVENPDRKIRSDEAWIHVARQDDGRGLAQGWKLHISATIITAPAVLKRVLPVLLGAGVEFKVAASIQHLRMLNMGRANRSQVGKFITVYPSDEAVAVKLAQQLHEVTVGLVGPAIPSDRPLHPGSLVHYRYGGFQFREMLTPISSLIPALVDSTGKLVPDGRNPWYSPPDWVTDPFAAMGATTTKIEQPGPVGTQYKVLKALHQTGKGGVYVAEDLHESPPRQKVLKEARQHVLTDKHRRDGHARLRHEYALLERLSPCPWLPKAYDLFEQDGSLFIVIELLSAKSLRSVLTAAALKGESLPLEQVCTLGRGLVDIMAHFHAQGIVLRDFTPNNVLLEENGEFRLIDLELAYETGSDQPPFDGCTRGYGQPAADLGGTKPAFTDDYYALGGCLFYLATHTDPVVPDDGRPVLARQMQLLDLLRPDLPTPFRNAIERLCQPNAKERTITLDEVRAALVPSVTVIGRPVPMPEPSDARERGYLAVARGVGEWLLSKERPDHPRFQWAPSGLGQVSMPNCIQFGAAGTGLFLADLYVATSDQRFLHAAERSAGWCQRWAKSPMNQNAPGLYFGHAGVPWLLTRLAQITENPCHLETASAYMRWIDSMDCPQIDISHGVAGVGLVHLALAKATGEAYHWRRVREIADLLVAQAKPIGEGLLWISNLSEKPEMFYGYAHGAAGIGYYLLEVARATAESRYLDTVNAVARALLAAYVPVRAGTGWSWSYSPANPLVWPHLCNGAAGVGQFLVRLYDLTGTPAYREAAEKAAVATFYGCRTTQAGLCHGVAGGGEFLIDLYQVLQDDQYLRQAQELSEILATRSLQVNGQTLWETDGSLKVDSDFMVGSAGVGEFHLRLALPNQFARAVMLPPERRPQVVGSQGGR